MAGSSTRIPSLPCWHHRALFLVTDFAGGTVVEAQEGAIRGSGITWQSAYASGAAICMTNHRRGRSVRKMTGLADYSIGSPGPSEGQGKSAKTSCFRVDVGSAGACIAKGHIYTMGITTCANHCDI